MKHEYYKMQNSYVTLDYKIKCIVSTYLNGTTIEAQLACYSFYA